MAVVTVNDAKNKVVVGNAVQGLPGLNASGSNRFTFNQATPALVWTFVNPLGVEPTSVMVYSTSNRQMLSQVDATATSVQITHAEAVAGHVVING
jgi:hypothetical protein